MNENELMHYGVLGMKWGHRKAQRTQRVKSVYSNKAQKQMNFNTKLAKAADRHLKSGKDVDNLPLTAETKKAYKHEYDTYTKAAKAWLSTRNDIMSMNVSSIKAKDIKRRFKNAKTNAGGAYIY